MRSEARATRLLYSAEDYKQQTGKVSKAVRPYKPLVVVEYQQDGSSFSMFKQYWNNPNGWMFYRKFEMKHTSSTKRKIKLSIHYISSCIRAKKYSALLNNPQPIITFFCLPIGIAFYLYTKHMANGNKIMNFNKSK